MSSINIDSPAEDLAEVTHVSDGLNPLVVILAASL